MFGEGEWKGHRGFHQERQDDLPNFGLRPGRAESRQRLYTSIAGSGIPAPHMSWRYCGLALLTYLWRIYGGPCIWGKLQVFFQLVRSNPNVNAFIRLEMLSSFLDADKSIIT